MMDDYKTSIFEMNTIINFDSYNFVTVKLSSYFLKYIDIQVFF